MKQKIRSLRGMKKVSLDRRVEHLQVNEYMVFPLRRAQNFAKRLTIGKLPRPQTEIPVQLHGGTTVWLVSINGTYQVRRYA